MPARLYWQRYRSSKSRCFLEIQYDIRHGTQFTRWWLLGHDAMCSVKCSQSLPLQCGLCVCWSQTRALLKVLKLLRCPLWHGHKEPHVRWRTEFPQIKKHLPAYYTHTHTQSHTHPAGTRKVNQSGFYWSKRQWVAVASAGHMHVCTLLQTDNHASTPPLSFFTGRMPFLPPNQQCQSTEGNFGILPAH